MMDLGLSGFIDKFEQYFGKALTFVLLFLVGAALASVCINAVVTFSIKPASDIISEAIAKRSLDTKALLDILIYMLTFLSMVMAGVGLGMALRQKRNISSIRTDLSGLSSETKTVFTTLLLATNELESILSTTTDPALQKEIQSVLAEISVRMTGLEKWLLANVIVSNPKDSDGKV